MTVQRRTLSTIADASVYVATMIITITAAALGAGYVRVAMVMGAVFGLALVTGAVATMILLPQPYLPELRVYRIEPGVYIAANGPAIAELWFMRRFGLSLQGDTGIVAVMTNERAPWRAVPYIVRIEAQPWHETSPQHHRA